MKLVAFRVNKFRNIVDSERVTVQPDVTNLVGKNESGKTAALNALYRLNPAYGEKFSVSEHYPRWLKTSDQKQGVIDDVDTITGYFELDDRDVQAAEGRFGKGILKDREFAYTQGYRSTRAVLAIDESVGIATIMSHSSAPQSTLDLFQQDTKLSTLRRSVATKISELQSSGDESGQLPDLQALQAEITVLIGEKLTLWQSVVALLRARMPKFFYFSQYQNLPGRINLEDVDEESEGPAATGMQTARALLKLADTTTDSLSDDDFEDRTAELEAVSNELTDQVFKYWSQNEKLEVQMAVDPKTEPHPSGNGQHVVVRYLDVRVKDRRHNYSSNFSQRSAGFQWFFSFLAAFSEFEDKDEDIVVLLDEPGLALHAKAQADFLRFIDERLAPKVQVIYTTHSPFMVAADKLERVRVVEDKGAKKGTVISGEVLSVDNDTLFPLQAALGYDIAQNLFVGPDNLIVEGTSDFTYLTIISDHLKALGRESLNESWRILPAGSVANIPSFVALMGRQLDVTVFVDSGASGLQRLNHLATQGLLKSKRLITVDQIVSVKNADIEDLFKPLDYLKLLYNPAFGINLTIGKLAAGDRIIDRIGRTQGSPFILHGKPADYLLRNRDKVLDKLSPDTLDNFENAIKRINGTSTS
ncbi:AAA family ATPase [Mycolicibacterium grossiae]|uniref:AAA family ATPase n=1 Tax=Mycolicibacterium grossiae TaxID=1552759 RepID=UPI0009F5BFE3|nr:AAA family ATPase [Mycolicibacterium grossiae]QEM43583.1 AAA family ATPase [Mycolicibacterium grossiae]